MVFEVNFRLFLLGLSVILSVVISIFSLLKGKKTPILFSYLGIQALIFIWLTAQILRIFAPNHQLEWLFVRYEYFAHCFIGISWLIFCLLYTENSFLKTRNLIALLISPVFFYTILLSNNYHHLFFARGDREFEQYAILFGLHTITTYLYCLTGMVLLLKYAIKQFGHAKIRSVLLAIAVVIPLILNAFFLTRVINPGFDITPISFSISLLLFMIVTFKFKFLNIKPVALSRIVDNLKEVIIVVDNFNRIVDINQAFTINFGKFGALKNQDQLNVFIQNLSGQLRMNQDSQKLLSAMADYQIYNISGELSLTPPPDNSYFVNIQPIMSSKRLLGRIISFNDITEYRQLLLKLNDQNQELSTMNQQLKDYATKVEELAITKERNRVARDVHDTLGQTMTLLITLLQVSNIALQNDPLKAQEKLTEALRVAGEGLTELRRSIAGLAPRRLTTDSLIKALDSLFSDYRKSGMEIEFLVSGLNDILLQDEHSGVIFRICQEALTNSLRHGKASQVDIMIRCCDGWLKLFIIDNGYGCAQINKGIGLVGMEERITSLQGRIAYGSDGESGFNIHVEIPLEVAVNQ